MTSIVSFVKGTTSKKLGAFLLVFGTSIFFAPSAYSAVNMTTVTCAMTTGETQVYNVGWDNTNSYFNGKGYIPALFCKEAAYQHPVYVSDTLSDPAFGWYNGVIVAQEPTPIASPEPSPTASPTPSPTPVQSETSTVSPSPSEPQSTPSSQPTPSATETSTPQPTPTPLPTPQLSETQTISSNPETQTVSVETSTVSLETTTASTPSTVDPVPSIPAQPIPVNEPVLPQSSPVESSPPKEEPTPQPEEQNSQPQIDPLPDPIPVETTPVEPTPVETPVEPTPIETPTEEPTPVVVPEAEPDPAPSPAPESPTPKDPISVPQEKPSVVVLSSEVNLKELPPETPVQLENGVILTAEVVVALQVLESPSELITTMFTDPGEALKAFANIGADLAPEVRAKAKKVIISAIVAGNIATTATLAASPAATYRRKP